MSTPDIPNAYVRIAGLLLGKADKDVHEGPWAEDLVQHFAYHYDNVEPGLDEFLGFTRRFFGHGVDLVDSVLEPVTLMALVSAHLKGWVSAASPSMTHGVWDHFKGGVYLSDRVERCADSGEPRVSYLSLLHGTWHSRRVSQWNSVVAWPDGLLRSRFVYRGANLSVPAPSFKVIA
jgi:hypothetical protein